MVHEAVAEGTELDLEAERRCVMELGDPKCYTLQYGHDIDPSQILTTLHILDDDLEDARELSVCEHRPFDGQLVQDAPALGREPHRPTLSQIQKSPSCREGP